MGSLELRRRPDRARATPLPRSGPHYDSTRADLDVRKGETAADTGDETDGKAQEQLDRHDQEGPSRATATMKAKPMEQPGRQRTAPQRPRGSRRDRDRHKRRESDVLRHQHRPCHIAGRRRPALPAVPAARSERGRDREGPRLAILAAIANAHHAELSAHAKPGGGVEITVRFPPERHDISATQVRDARRWPNGDTTRLSYGPDRDGNTSHAR
jgi:hypothetical protein